MERAEYFRNYFQLCKDFANVDDIDPLINLSLPHLKQFAIVLREPEGRQLFKEGTNTTDEAAIVIFEERLQELIEDLQGRNEDTDTSISDKEEEHDEDNENMLNSNPATPVVLANVADNIAAVDVEVAGNGAVQPVPVVENNNINNEVGNENAEELANIVPVDNCGNISDNEESKNPRSVGSTIVITDDDDNKTIVLSDSENDENEEVTIGVEEGLTAAADNVANEPSTNNVTELQQSPPRENSVPTTNEEEEENIEPARVILSSSSQSEEEIIPAPKNRKRILSPDESEDDDQGRKKVQKKKRVSFKSFSSSSENDDDDDAYEPPQRRRRRSTSSSERERRNLKNKKKKQASPKLQNDGQQPCSSKSFLNTAKKEENKDKKPRRPNFAPTKGMPRELARLQMSIGAKEARKNKINPAKEIKICYKDPVLYKTSSSSSSPSSSEKEDQSDKDNDMSIPFKKMKPIKHFRFGEMDIAGKRKLYIKEGEKQCRVFWFDLNFESEDMHVYFCYECRRCRKDTHAALSQISTDARVDPNHHNNCKLIPWTFS